MPVAFISGHLDLTIEEFQRYYVPQLETAVALHHHFVVGDANGADAMAQFWLWCRRVNCVAVYHMYERPRNNPGYMTLSGFKSDAERDAAMTQTSDYDLAWVRPGRGRSGTAKNLKRRQQKWNAWWQEHNHYGLVR